MALCLISAAFGPSYIVLLTTSEDPLVRKQQSVNLLQLLPLVLAAMLVTVGMSMYLSDASSLVDVVQSVVVVFGGALACLLLSFSVSQVLQALQIALVRGIYGGSSPRQMVRAMLKICEICRRDGLLGVAETRSNSPDVEAVCQLIGDASDDSTIRFALDRRMASERLVHQMSCDVFIFTAIYAVLFGLLGSLLRYVNASEDALIGSTVLPFVCGASLSIIIVVLIARLRAAHMRELIISEIAFHGATIILEDNNVQRLGSRLTLLIPAGMRT